MKKRKCVIEDVVLRSNAKVEPLLVEFANGRPLEGTQLMGTLHQRKSDSESSLRPSRRILTIETPKLSYAGTQDIGQPGGRMTMFLGLLDTETSKMKLVEASRYNVGPVLQTLSSANPLLLDDTPAHTLTYQEKQVAVTLAFGSKRARQAMNRRMRNKVEAESMSGAIDQAAAAAASTLKKTVEGQLEQEEESSLMDILPPCNREAETIEQVYKLQDLATDHFLANMEEPARALIADWKSDPKSPILFLELLESARHEPDEDNQVRLVCVALLVKHILAFLHLQGRDLMAVCKGKTKTKPKDLEDCPNRVLNSLLQEYTQKHTGVRSEKDKDRATCLAIILALIVSKYHLLVSTLLQSFPIKRDRLNTLMRIIGATYNSTTSSFVLKLPLAQRPLSHRKPRRPRR